jgi:hypothetical protein
MYDPTLPQVSDLPEPLTAKRCSWCGDEVIYSKRAEALPEGLDHEVICLFCAAGL